MVRRHRSDSRPEGSRTLPSSWAWGTALFGLVIVALLLRSLGFEWVLVDNDTVVFQLADAQYHVRRSFLAWMDFPRVVLYDSYLNHPGGAAVPWPPLFDFVVAAFAKLVARDAAAFQRAAAFTPPLIGALTLIPVYWLGRELHSRGVGLGAAALLAAFPMSVRYSQIGDVDHHCAVALVGAFLLLLCVRAVGGKGSPIGLTCGLVLARVAILLTWHGSLLYLGLVDATLCIAAIASGRRSLPAIQSASAVGALGIVAPIVWVFPEPLGGPYSAIALSRVHVLALLAAALVPACLWSIGRPPGRLVASPSLRLAWTATPALVFLFVLLLFPGPREGIELGLRFLTMSDEAGRKTMEQLPLFSFFGRWAGPPAWRAWGGFAYLIPLIPVAAVVAARRDRRGAAWVVAGWSAFFGVLALVQRRYGNDLGPAAALASALAIASIARRATSYFSAPGDGRSWLSPLLAVAIGLTLLAPPIWARYRPRAQSALTFLTGGYANRDRALGTVPGTLTRFMQAVRAVTPETSGYFDSSQTPEYGIVADANLGHALKNVAHRAAPTDPFWEPMGKQNWDRSQRLVSADSEARALELADQLRVRYLVTMSSAVPDKLEGWLHNHDGLEWESWPRTEHFRLITEGPRGGLPLAVDLRTVGFLVHKPSRAGAAPYKLFEIVAGAVLEVHAEPKVMVIAELLIQTPIGRRLRFEAKARTDGQGIARLRVPYPTRVPSRLGVAATRGPYRINTPAGNTRVHVSEAQVREGALIAVPMVNALAQRGSQKESVRSINQNAPRIPIE